jgi:hypothetical protein
MSMPIKALTKSTITSAREARYRRRLNLQIKTSEEAIEFINDVGFSFLFPIQNVEMPSLWDAVAGRVVKVSSSHDGYEINRTWGWKDSALDQKVWFYGKLIRDKATFVSLDFLPNFYALSENYGDYENDYLEEYEAGTLTAEAKSIYEALLKHGALDAIRLRRESHLSSDAAKGRFDKALTDLQTGLKVIPVGVAPVGAWKYAFIYEILPRWFPSIPDRARKIGRAEAKRSIVDQYLRNVIASTPKSIARVFGWKLIEVQQLLEDLVSKRRVAIDVKVSGIKETQIVTAQIVS